MAEDQQRVEDQVHRHANDARDHGQHRPVGLAQRAGIALCHHEGNEAKEHDGKVALGVAEAGLDLRGVALALEVQADEVVPEEEKNRSAQRR